MNATDKEFGSRHPNAGLRPFGLAQDRRAQSSRGSGPFVRCGWLSIYACALLIASLDRNAVCGETLVDEDIRLMASTELDQMSPVETLDPTSMLSDDSAQNEEEPGLPDIQIYPYSDLPAYYTPGPIDGFATNFASAVKDELSQISPPPAEQLEHQLWQNRISPLSQPSADSPAVSSSALSSLPKGLSNRKMDDLKKAIEQIRSIEAGPPRDELVEPQQPAQQPSDTSPAITPEPNTNPPAEPPVVSIVEPETQPSPAPGQSPTPDRRISDRTVQMIDELLKDANHITNPLELAEVLFRGGRAGTAGLYYKQALATIAADDPNMADERAWILFQIGNCLKYDDPNTARQSYAELIRTYPDSPWAEAAKAGHNLIDWEQQEQPRKLIQDLNSSRRSAPQPGK